MDMPDLSAERDRSLDRAVALTVLLVSITLALGKIKDANIVQAMQQEVSDQVDLWSEYQAARIKLHAQHIAAQTFALTPGAATAAAVAEAERQVARYDRESAGLRRQAQGIVADHDRRGRRHDQFDLGAGFGSISLAVSAVAAVVESRRLLIVGWLFAAGAALFVAAGFLELPIHPDTLVAFLT